MFATGAGLTVSTSQVCPGLGDPVAQGALTVASDETIEQLVVDAESGCLFHVDGIVTTMEWGPQGDRILLNDRLIVGGPANGQIVPEGVDWEFTYPTGLNLIGIRGGAIVKFVPATGAEETLTPITKHSAVSYHPSGLHVAVGGLEQPPEADLDPIEGIFISERDGNDAVNLILGFGTTIHDIQFANDGSRMYFLAEHDGQLHFHSIETVPSDIEGTPVLGAGAEDFATTHASASGAGRVEFTKLLVHPNHPEIAAWTTAECDPGSKGFQIIAGEDGSLIQAIGSASAIGLLDSSPDAVIVAAVSGACDGLRELGLMSVDLESGEVVNIPAAEGFRAAAVRNVVTAAKYDLSGVEIVGFA